MKTNSRIIWFVFILVFTFTLTGKSQDGKSLFNANCAACHHQIKNGVGPALQNVREKWNKNADTEGLIYIWVNDFEKAALIDPYAKAAVDLKTSEMNKFNLTNEEIDAIFDYVDAPIVEDNKGTSNAETVVISIPDYEENLNIMILLLVIGLILILYILTMVHTIKMVVGSKLYSEKSDNESKAGSTTVKTIIMLVGLSLIPAVSMAVSAPVIPEETETFFKITSTDLWYMLTIDMILFAGALYMRYVFRQLVSMKRNPVKIRFFRKRTGKAFKAVFNNAVPIEQEADILMDHEYDGIRELDNRLPSWWLYMFYATILFAVVYVFHYHVLRTGDLQITAYNKEMIESQAEVDAYLKEMALNVDENSVVMLTDAKSLSAGRTLFNSQCKLCHGENGEGGNGANLSDNYWIYGNKISDIFRTIKYGGNNGMKSWQSEFNPVEIQLLTSYVASFNQVITPEEGGKQPEGDFFEPRIYLEDTTAVKADVE